MIRLFHQLTGIRITTTIPAVPIQRIQKCGTPYGNLKSLPSTLNLFNRGCLVILYALNVPSLLKTTHVFMGCDWVKQVWFASPLTIKMENNNKSFIDWITQMLSSLDKESMAYIAALIYQIWHSRNLMVFQNKHIPA